MLLIPEQGQGRPAFIEPVLCCSYGPPILHTIRMKPTPTSVLFLWLLAGCTGSPDGSVVSRTDSAGVAMVESSEPRWGEGEGWRVGSEILDLSREGDVNYEFDRVVDQLRVPTGEIAVAEPTRVRLYDSAGAFRWSFGRDGEGPGEFNRLSDLELRGDTLVAWDYWARRATLITRDGGLVRVVQLGEGVLGDDLLLLGDRLALETRFPSVMVEGGPLGLARVPSPIIGVDWDGRTLGSIAESPGVESVRISGPNGVADHRPLFGRSSHLAQLNGDLVIGDAVFLGYRLFDAEGRLIRIVRASTDLTMTDSLFQDERDARLEMSRDPTGTLQALSLLPRPELRPAFLDLMTDQTGAVWLREHRGEFRNFLHGDPRKWDVFGPDGEWLGALHTPAAVEIHQIGDDWILGIRTDDMGLQHPVLLSLDRDTDTLFAATGMSDQTVLTFIAALQEAVRRSDAAAVAQMVHYPLRVNNDSGSTSVDSAEAFIQQYAELMTPSISELVINARPGELFSSWRGLMFGAGEVWVSGVCSEDGVTCPPGIIALNH